MDFDLLKDFVADSRDLLDEVEPDLISLFREYSNNSKTNADYETINKVFRLFHSLKGSAGFLQLDNLVAVAHHAETLLDLFRRGNANLAKSHINVLCACCDLIRRMLGDILIKGTDIEHQIPCQQMIVSINELLELLTNPASEEISEPIPEISTHGQIVITEEMVLSFVQESEDQLKLIEACILILAQLSDEESLQEAFRCFHSIKGNAGFLGFKDIEAVAHKAEDALELIASRKEQLSEKSCQILLKVVDQLRASISKSGGKAPTIRGVKKLLQEIEKISATPATISPVLATAPAKESPSDSNIPVVDKSWRQNVKQKSKSSEEAPESRRDIRVDLEKLDQLINLVGELVIAESMVIHNPDLEGHEFENFEKASRHLQKISRDLQDIALAIRMVPLASTFKKMLRLVHDLSNKTHKKIDLLIRGEDTEIDKTLVESLSDPLVHLIRNCADHGIETPQERIKAGKPETGTIRLEASHEEGEVQILVSDDGRGLNAEKIYNKALEKGLIAEGQELSDKDLFKLIFEPGFSTADSVSDISGRGVGLDVLKKNLEKLQGHIDIRNRPGLGCTFILRIPLTLAIIEGMLVRVGTRHYTIPLLSIRESLKAKKEQITNTMDGRELFSLRKELIPIVRLHGLHNISEGIQNIEEGIIVILESGVGVCGLLVDKVIGQQQTVIKPLSGFLGHMRGVCGCTIMGNGDISLILDISTLLDLGNEEAIA